MTKKIASIKHKDDVFLDLWLPEINFEYGGCCD